MNQEGSRAAAWLAGILALALTLRLGVVLAWPSIYFPDEIFQTLEPAHRLVFGYGVVPWEYRLGIRSWILPGLLAGLLRLGSMLGEAPEIATRFVGVCLAAISLVVVACAFRLGRRVSLTHAVTAGFAAAVWFELVQQAGRTLSEVVATVPLVVALTLASRPALDRARLVGIGLCLGLTFVLRFQLAPGLAVVALYIVWTYRGAGLLALLVGGLPPLAAMGLVDALTWGEPFASITRNFTANIVDGRAAAFSTSPFYNYVLSIGARWVFAFPLILGLAALAARRFPLWLAVAAVIIVFHSFIAHKENRFVFPAVTCLVILAGIGTGDVIAWLRQRAGRGNSRAWLLPASLAAWLAASLILSLGPYARSNWTAGRGQLEAMHWLHRQDDLCGLGIGEFAWFDTGGYVHLRRPVPIYIGHRDRPLQAVAAKFNYVLAPGGWQAPGYAQAQCFADAVCVFRRVGTCEAVAGDAINDVLVQLNQ